MDVQGHNQTNTTGPPTSGTNSKAVLRLSSRITTAVLDMGIASNAHAYIQSTLSGNLASNRELRLNPNGGNVAIGNSTTDNSLYRLFVNGAFGANNVSVGTNASPTALVDIAGSTTSNSNFRLRTGTAPTSPNEGDVWSTTAGLFTRFGGVTTSIITGYRGSGTPEGVVTAPIGSIYQRSDAEGVYFKQTGTGNTGWVLGVSNLGYTTDASTGTVTNTGGTPAVLPAATDLIAGLLSASDYVTLQALRQVRQDVVSGTTDGSGDLTITFGSAMPDATYALIVQAEGTTYFTTTVHTKTSGGAKVRFFDATGAALTSTAVTVGYNAKNY